MIRLLLDASLSHLIATPLTSAGYDVVHIGQLGMLTADDRSIMQRAAADGRVVLAQETDFGTLLAQQRALRPSVVLLRVRNGRPAHQARLLLEALPQISSDLERGAIAVVTDAAIRVRQLPVERGSAEP